MSSDTKQVSHSVRETIDGIKKKAAGVVDKMNRNAADMHQALDMADELADSYGDDAREIRAILGAHTNNPPKDASDPLA